MPADFIIKTGDMIQITIAPPAVVPSLIAPVPLVGSSSNVKVNQMLICLEGDELPKMLLSPQPYFCPPFVVPGMVMVSLKLNPTNKTMISKNKKPILIKGTPFVAEFQVTAPAQMPPPISTPDPVMKKVGTAQFITTNINVKAG